MALIYWVKYNTEKHRNFRSR